MTGEEKQSRSLIGVRETMSRERLDAYGIGRPDEEKLSNYVWNVELCRSLYPVLHGLEVALRNAILRAGAAAFPGVNGRDVPCWLDADPPIILLDDQRFIDEAKSRLRQQGKPMDPGRLVSELGFGFWATTFDVRYERGNRLWPRLFTHGLLQPEAPRSLRTRKRLSPMINRARLLRNRVFHHKAIWHWRDLEQQYGSVLDLLRWFGPPLIPLLEPSERFIDVLRAGPAPFRERAGELLRAGA